MKAKVIHVICLILGPSVIDSQYLTLGYPQSIPESKKHMRMDSMGARALDLEAVG